MKLFYHSGSMFAKMLVSFTIVLTALTLVLSYVLYFNFEQVTLNTMKKTNTKFLLQMSYSANYMNDSARNFAWSIFGDANTVSFMYQNSTDFTQLISGMDRINRFIHMNPFVDSVYIYNKKLNRYLASGSAAVNSGDTFYDQGIVKIMEKSVPAERLVPIPRVMQLSLGSPDDLSNSINVYTYIIYDIFSQKGGIEGAVIINIKGEYLQNIMNSMGTKDTLLAGDTFVIDQQGVVVSTSQNNFLSDFSPQAFVQKISDDKNESGFFKDTIDHRRMMVTYVSSEILGWKFIHVEPYETIISDIQKMKWITIMVCIVLLMFGLLTSFLVSRRLYLPIRNLVGKVTQLMDTSPYSKKQNTDEIGFLNRAISEAYIAKRDTMLNRKNDILKKLLLNDDVSFETLPVLFRKYNISIDPLEKYMLVALRIDHLAKFISEYTERDRELFRYSIGNSAGELIGNHFSNETVDMGDDLLVIIVTAGKESLDDVQNKISGIIGHIQQWCIEYLRLSVSAAIGYVAKNLSEINRSYQEVIHISNYRLLSGHQSVLTPESLREQNTDHYKMASGEENLLYDALVNGKLDEAMKVYKGIINKVTQYSYDAIMSNIHYLTYSVYNTLNVMEGNSFDRFEVDFNTFVRQIYQSETMEEINQLFHGLFAHITNVVNSRRDKRSTVLIDSMIGIIELNYMDKGLCLESIANTMNMSKVYVGKVFRESCGQSVADFILDIRMDKALELLHEGNKHLDHILDKIGFENKKYFYTLFKKKFGVAFSDYKLKNLNDILHDEEGTP